MHRFIAQRVDECHAVLSMEESAHAERVLRMQAGDACQALMEGEIYAASIEKVQGEILLRLHEKLPSPEPALSVTLYQGLPKGEKMEWIIQKCTEVGVKRIVPVLFSRCITKWEKKDDEKKLPRLQRIAAEATKQSGRAQVPVIEAPITLPRLCQRLPAHDLCLVPWEDQRGNSIRNQFKSQTNIALIIGPEGGISVGEIDTLQSAGAVPVTLGPRILRTETAGLAALVSLLTLSGDMDSSR